ncbi:hypothetical protein F4780DRAFT_176440 [Xylariomycetidae sp. FL0641]|nr:hypothetical protein F4780DRAFT_176440 [Xylariomycetidae sp. FL0641]
MQSDGHNPSKPEYQRLEKKGQKSQREHVTDSQVRRVHLGGFSLRSPAPVDYDRARKDHCDEADRNNRCAHHRSKGDDPGTDGRSAQVPSVPWCRYLNTNFGPRGYEPVRPSRRLFSDGELVTSYQSARRPSARSGKSCHTQRSKSKPVARSHFGLGLCPRSTIPACPDDRSRSRRLSSAPACDRYLMRKVKSTTKTHRTH